MNTIKTSVYLSIILGLVLVSGSVFAERSDEVIVILDTPGTEQTLKLPSTADNSPVISLGTGIDPRTGKVVEGIAFIHYKKGYHHRQGHTGGPGSGDTSSVCYAYLASGAKWKTAEDWIINGTNSHGFLDTFLKDNTAGNIAKWEISSGGANILGNGALTGTVLSADEISPDDQNEVYFGDIDDPGAIAVTIVWGIFRGPPSQRELVEWDQVYDDIDFSWSNIGELASTSMDFENVSTHEIGHSVGMGHPSDSCAEETMFRFADEGETKKRDLNTGDIQGIDNLY